MQKHVILRKVLLTLLELKQITEDDYEGIKTFTDYFKLKDFKTEN